MGKGGGGLGGIVGSVTSPLSKVTGFNPFEAVSDFRNDMFGINDQADAAQAGAMAEMRARQAATAEARQARNRMNLAAQSPQQLAALERSLAAARTQVDTDLKQLAAIDPAIMEASKQVMQILQGGQSAQTAGIMSQRNQQRQELLNSLRAQYGPGAESTSIGQRALQQFDLQTNSVQQNALGNLFGIATTRVAGPGFAQLMGAAGGFGDYQGRLLGAEQAGSQNILGAMLGEVQSAAAPYTSDLLKAGARRQFWENLEGDVRQIGRTHLTGNSGTGKVV